MLNVTFLKVELQNFFSRKYRLAILTLACYAAMC